MKKLLFILGLFGVLNAQNVNPETFTEVTDKTSALTKYVYTNTGGEGKISVDSLRSWFSNKVDSGEVIGDFLYLFSGDDTTIVDMSSLAGGDSIWTIANGDIVNVDTNKAFSHYFEGGYLVNDSFDLGFLKIPFIGAQGPDIGTYKGVTGYLDGSSVGGGKQFGIGYIDFFNTKYNSIFISDTSSISIVGNDDISIDANNSITTNASNITTNANNSITTNASNITTNASNNIIVSAIDITTNASDITTNASDNMKINTGALYLAVDSVQYGGVGAALNKGDLVYKYTVSPYDTIPQAVLELQKLKEYATGFATLHAPDKKYANIYYGTLDSVTNLITYITRVEATKEHVQMKLHEDYVHLDSLGFRVDIDSHNSVSFKVDSNGINTPNIGTEPTGVSGAVYYDGPNTTFRGYVNQWASIVLVSDSIYLNDTDADNDPNLTSRMAYRLIGDKTLYIKP